jgi:type I restriction enzyme S subunit
MNEQATLSSVETEKGFQHHELGFIPEVWKVVELSEDTEIEMGSSPKSKYYNENGEGLPFYQGNNEFGKRHPKTEVWCNEPVKTAESGDILISVRAPVGDLNIADEKCCIGRGLAGISNGEFNKNYLFYQLQERKKWLKRISAGSTYDSINSTQLKNLELRKPPKEEQEKIASVLYNVDQAIQKTEEIIEKTQRVKKGLIQELTMEGVQNQNFRELDVIPKFLDLKIPEDWEKVSYDEISENITYGFTSPMPEAEEGPWMITAKDIKGERINYEEARKTTKEAYKNKITGKSRPPVGNVLITKDGTLGRVGIVDREDICINQSVASINPIEDKVLPEYLVLTLKSPLTKKLIKAHNPQTTIGHIKISELAEWEFGLPQIEEQEKIVAIIDSVRKKLQSEKENKRRLERIKKGLMQDLLTGEVRTDEKDIEVLEEVEV